MCESLLVILGNSDEIQHYSATTTETGYYWSDTGTKNPIGMT